MFRLQNGTNLIRKAVTDRLRAAIIHLFGEDIGDTRVAGFLSGSPYINYPKVGPQEIRMVQERLQAILRCLEDEKYEYTFDSFSEFLIVQVMESLKNDAEWRKTGGRYTLPGLMDDCIEYASVLEDEDEDWDLDEDEEEEDWEKEGGNIADGGDLYWAVIDLFPMADEGSWYFDIMFWDTDFAFFAGWPKKGIPVPQFEASKLEI